MNRYSVLFASAVYFFVICIAAAGSPLPYTGVNLAGAEFGPAPQKGVLAVYNVAYTYPTRAEIDYFARKGMNVIRLPFRWERLQPLENGPLDGAELGRLRAVAEYATGKHLDVLLDPHNSARYFDQIVGTAELPASVMADFWSRVAEVFKDNRRVWFGLTNEPHSMPSDVWLADANASIAAIRAAGAKNKILVAGNGYSAACDWMRNGNDCVMLGIRDPGRNWAFEPHAYLDEDNSGTHKTVVSPTIGVERLTAFTEWCRKHRYHAFLGEFAAPESTISREAVDNMLSYMEKNRDVWIGFAWWAAGPWWGDYMFSIEPRKDGSDSPRLAYLAGHLQN